MQTMSSDKVVMLAIAALIGDRFGVKLSYLCTAAVLLMLPPFLRRSSFKNYWRKWQQSKLKLHTLKTLYHEYRDVTQVLLLNTVGVLPEKTLAKTLRGHPVKVVSITHAKMTYRDFLFKRFSGLILSIDVSILMTRDEQEIVTAHHGLLQTLEEISNTAGVAWPVHIFLYNFDVEIHAANQCLAFQITESCTLTQAVAKLQHELHKFLFAALDPFESVDNLGLLQKLERLPALSDKMQQLIGPLAINILITQLQLTAAVSPSLLTALLRRPDRFLSWRLVCQRGLRYAYYAVPLSLSCLIGTNALHAYSLADHSITRIAKQTQQANPDSLLQLPQSVPSSLIKLKRRNTIRELLAELQQQITYQHVLLPLLHTTRQQLIAYQKMSDVSFTHYRLWKFAVVLANQINASGLTAELHYFATQFQLLGERQHLPQRQLLFKASPTVLKPSLLAASAKLLTARRYFHTQEILAKNKSWNMNLDSWHTTVKTKLCYLQQISQLQTSSPKPQATTNQYAYIDPFTPLHPQQAISLTTKIKHDALFIWQHTLEQQLHRIKRSRAVNWYQWRINADYALEHTIPTLQNILLAVIKLSTIQRQSLKKICEQPPGNTLLEKNLITYFKHLHTSLVQLHNSTEEFESRSARLSFAQAKHNSLKRAVQQLHDIKRSLPKHPLIAPSMQVIEQLLQNFWQILLHDMQRDLNQAWQEQVYSFYQQHLARNFPFNLHSDVDVSTEALQEFMGHTNSHMNRFLSHYAFTQLKNPLPSQHTLIILPQHQQQLACWQQRQQAMYPYHRALLHIPLQIYPHPDPQIKKFSLDIGGSTYHYVNTPQQWQPLTWSPASNISYLQAISLNETHDLYLESNGSWAFWHLLTKTQLEQLKPHHYRVKLQHLQFDLKLDAAQDILALFFYQHCELPKTLFTLQTQPIVDAANERQ
jgi:Type VI secretion protein IcmF C2-like domain